MLFLYPQPSCIRHRPGYDKSINVQGNQAKSGSNSDNYHTDVEALVDNIVMTCKELTKPKVSLVDKSNSEDYNRRLDQ